MVFICASLMISDVEQFLRREIPSLVSLAWESVLVQSLSCVQLFATEWTAALQASCPSHLLEFAQTHVH